MTNQAKNSRISRRSFLKLTGAALGASALACGGMGYLATTRFGVEPLEPSTCGDTNLMNAKILVTYGTRCGSTAEIAQAIGQALCQGGASADVRPVKDVPSLDGYDGVVIGSAIRMGAWLPEVVSFIRANQDRLSRMPRAYFQAGMFLKDNTPAAQAQAEAYLDPVRKLVEPDQYALFVGKMDTTKLSWLERQMTKALKVENADYRDWDAIRTWADGLQQELLTQAPA